MIEWLSVSPFSRTSPVESYNFSIKISSISPVNFTDKMVIFKFDILPVPVGYLRGEQGKVQQEHRSKADEKHDGTNKN